MVEALSRESGLTRRVVLAALSERFFYPVLEPSELHALEPDFEAISFPACKEHSVVAARDAQGAIHLLLTDPFDGATEQWALRSIARAGGSCITALADEDDLHAYLAVHERKLRAIDVLPEQTSISAAEGDSVTDITLSKISGDTSPVVKLVNSTIYDALHVQASDIHLECDGETLRVLYRIDGVLVPIAETHGERVAEEVVSRVKVMADLDIAERRVPQDGRFRVRVNGHDVDFRVSIMPNIFGEDAVLRLLDRKSISDQSTVLRLDDLGLDQVSMSAIRRLARKPHGMLLVTGPTGSGKTTTLYGAISEINTGRDKIVTIEDPVEYRLPRVLQIPVNEKKGLTFARGLRSILRHDPDKIMVGEIRDGETAQIAVQAALTGHLVFTTVHANSVFDVLSRFLHMGVDPYSLAAALNGIVAQRLLRLNCRNCEQEEHPSEEDLDQAGLKPGQVLGWTFRRGLGCGHCRGTGFKGRKAIAEVLVLTEEMRELIATRAPVARLRELAKQGGLRTLSEAAWFCLAGGETALEEVVRVAG